MIQLRFKEETNLRVLVNSYVALELHKSSQTNQKKRGLESSNVTPNNGFVWMVVVSCDGPELVDTRWIPLGWLQERQRKIQYGCTTYVVLTSTASVQENNDTNVLVPPIFVANNKNQSIHSTIFQTTAALHWLLRNTRDSSDK